MNINYDELPAHMRSGARDYIEKGVHPGAFLAAIIQNNFVDAVGKADSVNIKHLAEWGHWLLWEIPSAAWGSKEKMSFWIQKGGLSNLSKQDI
jgi:hypothetical protein